jgi:hypothetical protein
LATVNFESAIERITEIFMKRGVKISLIAVAVVLIAAVAAFGWLFSKAIPLGTGYVAKYLCSSTFISNRNPEI